MSITATRRYGRVVTVSSVHPEYRQALATYLTNLDIELVTVDAPGGVVDPARLAAEVNDHTACVLVQHPNFFGCLEQVEEDAGSLQSCSEAGKTIGASAMRSEGRAVFLRVVRSWGNRRGSFPVTGAARRALSSLEKTGQRRC